MRGPQHFPGQGDRRWQRAAAATAPAGTATAAAFACRTPRSGWRACQGLRRCTARTAKLRRRRRHRLRHRCRPPRRPAAARAPPPPLRRLSKQRRHYYHRMGTAACNRRGIACVAPCTQQKGAGSRLGPAMRHGGTHACAPSPLSAQWTQPTDCMCGGAPLKKVAAEKGSGAHRAWRLL